MGRQASLFTHLSTMIAMGTRVKKRRMSDQWLTFQPADLPLTAREIGRPNRSDRTSDRGWCHGRRRGVSLWGGCSGFYEVRSQKDDDCSMRGRRKGDVCIWKEKKKKKKRGGGNWEVYDLADVVVHTRPIFQLRHIPTLILKRQLFCSKPNIVKEDETSRWVMFTVLLLL